MKAYKGFIQNWSKQFFDYDTILKQYGEEPGLGYIIQGIPQGHPQFQGWLHTSWVVKHDEMTGEIETRNSRYTLVGPEIKQ